MFPWHDILGLVAGGTLSVFLQPVFWLILLVVGYQYRQMQRNQIRMFGVAGTTVVRQVLLAAAYGTAGGILGSCLLTYAGITLNQIALDYLWPVALVLMVVNLRFLCFAYAGGLVALSNLIFGWPAVNIPQLLALVAILHVTESMLIAVSGRYGAVPLILRRRDGRVVGAFSLQNFWPLPLVLLTATAVPSGQVPAGMVNMPDWWPLLPLTLSLPEGSQWVYILMPVVAALGYGDMAAATLPSQRRLLSAFHLALYSAVLFVLALLSARYAWLQIVAAVVSPVGHEFLIQWDNRHEMQGTPLFVPPARGVKILDTAVNTPARAAGLRPGDILTELGGLPVNSRLDLAQAIAAAPETFTVRYVRDCLPLEAGLRFRNGVRQLGIILVPEGDETYFAELATDRFWPWQWLRRKFLRRS